MPRNTGTSRMVVWKTKNYILIKFCVIYNNISKFVVKLIYIYNCKYKTLIYFILFYKMIFAVN